MSRLVYVYYDALARRAENVMVYMQMGCRIKSPPTKICTEKIPLNAVEREPVETRVLNPNASYKPKQRSYRKTKLIIFFSRVILVGGILSGNRLRHISGDSVHNFPIDFEPMMGYYFVINHEENYEHNQISFIPTRKTNPVYVCAL